MKMFHSCSSNLEILLSLHSHSQIYEALGYLTFVTFLFSKKLLAVWAKFSVFKITLNIKKKKFKRFYH